MKKLFFLFVLVLGFLVVVSGVLHSQTKDTAKITKLNKPFLIIDVNGGIDIPLMDLTGDSPKDIYDFKSYGMGIGPATSINVKMAIFTRPMYQWRLYSTLGYAHFAKSGSTAYNIGVLNNNNYNYSKGWPYLGTYRPPVDTPGTSFARINNFYYSFGLEHSRYLDKEAKSSLNFGVDIDLSLITGRVYEEYPDQPADKIFNTIEPAMRFGIGGNIVYNYRFNNALGLNIGARFMWANMLGKSNNETTDPGWMDLNDKEDETLLYNGAPIHQYRREIAFLKFFAGLSFYIGKR